MFPESFLSTMKSLVGVEFDDFLHALNQSYERGVRLHRISTAPLSASGQDSSPKSTLSIEQPLQSVPQSVQDQLISPIPWMDDAYYIPFESQLGKTVYHETGAFYLQEPSAMAVASALSVRPGERVLDLCAAPGGKTTAIGRALQGRGTLVANEIHPTRVVTLAQNLERTGVPAVVTNENPTRLSDLWQGTFDAVLVDAPCSGEGMFRKDPGAIQAWNPEAPDFCANRQREILTHAIQMVRPGGRLVYSTCTFNPKENEQIVAWALEHFPLEILPLPHWPGWDEGMPGFANDVEACRHARRLWPHRGRGEGHFVALFQVLDSKAQLNVPVAKQGITAQTVDASSWLHELLVHVPNHWQKPYLHKDQLMTDESGDVPLKGIKVLRTGIQLASVAKNRWEPHHHLAMALSPHAARLTHQLSLEEAKAYMGGQAIAPAPAPGWTWLHINGLPVGFGKSIPGRINNQYPRGLRRSDFVD